MPTSVYYDVYENLMLIYTSQLDFSQCVNFPTRLGNTLNLVLTIKPDRLHSLTTLPPFSNSDHYTITFTLFTGVSLLVIHRPKLSRHLDYKHANLAAINLALCATDWDVSFINCHSVHQMWDTFVHNLEIILQFIPLVKGASYVVRKKPWLPLCVKRASATKAATWRQ